MCRPSQSSCLIRGLDLFAATPLGHRIDRRHAAQCRNLLVGAGLVVLRGVCVRYIRLPSISMWPRMAFSQRLATHRDSAPAGESGVPSHHSEGRARR
jgi:hypothetical protein